MSICVCIYTYIHGYTNNGMDHTYTMGYSSDATETVSRLISFGACSIHTFQALPAWQGTAICDLVAACVTYNRSTTKSQESRAA